MLRRRRIWLVALLGAAFVAYLVSGGEDDPDSREADRSRRAGSESSADAAQIASRDSRRRVDGSETAADPNQQVELDRGFGRSDGRYAGTDSRDEEAEESDSLMADDMPPVALYALRGSRQDPSVSIVGFDPLGPRELLAWRLKHGRFAIAARGSSDRDGTLHFPDLVAARDGLEIVVTATDGVPGLPGASEPRRSPARDPLPPHARLLATDAEGHRIRIAPREGSGAVLLADAYGVVLGRYPIAPSPVAATRSFDVSLTAVEFDTHILVSQEFSDGRVSEWESLDLPAVEPVEDESE